MNDQNKVIVEQQESAVTVTEAADLGGTVEVESSDSPALVQVEDYSGSISVVEIEPVTEIVQVSVEGDTNTVVIDNETISVVTVGVIESGGGADKYYEHPFTNLSS